MKLVKNGSKNNNDADNFQIPYSHKQPRVRE